MPPSSRPLGQGGEDITISTQWFEAAVRASHVQSVLTREIPELASGELTLLDCAIKRLRSAEPEGYWTASYMLTLAGASFGTGRTVAARGVLIPPGAPTPEPYAAQRLGAETWRCFLPELRLDLSIDGGGDAALPAVELLRDPPQSRRLLESVLRTANADWRDVALSGVAPEVIDYKPGARCTILCHLEYSDVSATDPRCPEVVVAKVHADDAGVQIYRYMRALWESRFGRSRHVSMARPLGYVTELHMLVQSAVPEEQTLKALFQSAVLNGSRVTMRELEEALRRTARGLADLHHSGLSEGPVVSWSDELVTLRAKRDKLAAVVPRLTDLDASVFDRMAAADVTTSSHVMVPVHHSFRPSQVLLAGTSMSFIDFDKSCRSEPESDLAMLTTKLRHMSLNKVQLTGEADEDDEVLDDGTRRARIGQADRLCEVFVSEYERCAPLNARRLALWEALELFSLILSAAKKSNPGRVENCVFMFDEHLRVRGL
ncbi:MAG: phosphotransferase [Nocardioidaceae bacterium]